MSTVLAPGLEGCTALAAPPGSLESLRAAWPQVAGVASTADPTQPPPRLWRLDLAHPVLPAWADTLDEAQRQRAARFKFDADRRRHVAAHAAERAALAQSNPSAAARLRLTTGPQGKPEAVDAALGHNLSHSHDVGLLVVGSAAVGWGVDVECLREVDDVEGVAQRVFTPREFQQWSRTPAPDAMRAFLQLWTRKEACLKAIGSGFSVEPARFEAGLEPGPGGGPHPPWQVVELPTPVGPPTRVLLADLDAGDDVVAAWAAWPLPVPTAVAGQVGLLD
jgi:4'-phosphopantetheinyl transferase